MSESPREVAIGRLMTICPNATPEERRVQAEWIFDGIADALADQSKRMRAAAHEAGWDAALAFRDSAPNEAAR